MSGPMFYVRILIGAICTYWLVRTIQFTVIPKHFRILNPTEIYLLIAAGTVIYIFLPPVWLIIVLGLYLYHHKIRGPRN